MQELHPKITEPAERLWRIAALGAFVVGIFYLYSSIEDLQSTYKNIANGIDLFQFFVILLLKIGSIGLFVLIGGFYWGAMRAYLRLTDGYLEYHYTILRWPITSKVDLRTVGVARIGDHVRGYGRRKTSERAILFSSKENLETMPQKEAEQFEAKYSLLPKGISDNEAGAFLQKVNEEIERVNGG